jgi:hypothetical protein
MIPHPAKFAAETGPINPNKPGGPQDQNPAPFEEEEED